MNLRWRSAAQGCTPLGNGN